MPAARPGRARFGARPDRPVMVERQGPLAATHVYRRRRLRGTGPQFGPLTPAHSCQRCPIRCQRCPMIAADAAHSYASPTLAVWGSGFESLSSTGILRAQSWRLMKDLGLQGVRRGKRWKTTTADPAAPRWADLVQRWFNPARRNALWVADLRNGSELGRRGLRRLRHRRLGPAHPRRAAAKMTRTQLVLDLPEQAVWVRRREGGNLAGLVHHTDAVSTPRSDSPNVLQASILAAGQGCGSPRRWVP